MATTYKIRVMIVDDVSETRENIRKLLNLESDVDVIGVARTGKEAIQLSQDLNPDVVLMDINMPDMDGISATEAIRAKQPAVQVVILSIQGDQNYMRRAMLAGARDYLTKPPLDDELISAIRRAGSMSEEEARARLKVRELELTLFDLETRCNLYKDNVVTAKVVDEIEVLISGLAHDIRSPINIILSILATIKSKNKNTNDALKKIWRRCIYCKWVADNFLAISLSEKITVKEILLKKAIDEAIELLEHRIPRTITIQNNINEDIQVYVDPGLLRLVCLNLLSNSLESIINVGTISIDFERRGNLIAVFVEDNGPQIAPDLIQNLFKLAFTTKKSHAGTGLYASKRLLQQQQGDLEFIRDFHKKTNIFMILLPNEESLDERPIDVSLFHDHIALLKYWIDRLQEELSEFRHQHISESQQEEISKEFRTLTTTFSQSLSNELLIIEATVLDITQKLPAHGKYIENSFKKIIRNCAYCRLLINNTLELGEGISSKPGKISLIDTLEDVLLLVDRKMPPDIYETEWEVDPFLADIEADEVQMKQVFMNLIKNALDAMPNGGTLSIKLFQNGDFAVAEIGDTGVGIPSDNMSRLFQLGFTTKPKGYGIGLYSIKKIVERHNGEIKVSSSPQKGTVFVVKLPLKLKVQEA